MLAETREPIQVQPAESLREWLRANNPAAKEIGQDANLLGEGILDSFQFVNFVLHIESLRGLEIDKSRIEPRSFATINAILENFFPPSVRA